jgi:shikimate dehydrogenase
MIITALIGYPTAHSVSPTLFSIYAKDADLEYSHLKLDVVPGNLSEVIKAIRILGFNGLNVTLPYKIDVMKYLDHIDSEAREIGAVNTIVNKRGKLYGYNTDSFGALTSIKTHTPSLVSKKVVIFGTGGAARALISGLITNKARVTVVYRNPKSKRTKGAIKKFSKKVNFMSYKGSDLVRIMSEAKIICNATSCGMIPNSESSPLSDEILKKVALSSHLSEKLFFDTIFNPYESQFLKKAKKLGADIQGGTEMMIYQGVKAFKLWTGREVGINSVEKAKLVLRKQLLHQK